MENGVGIPHIHQYGQSKKHNYMVMDLLGSSLESLFNYCRRKFSVKTVLMLADQMIRRIEYIHSKGVIHRDIKPNNFVIGRGNDSMKIFLIDFGLAKKYINFTDGLHIPYTEDNKFIGTLRYASIQTHSGTAHARRDDLESLGYCLIYFLKGSLPWQNMKSNSDKRQRSERILEKKLSTSLSVLCAGLPMEFELFLKYCRERYFDETPNYGYLRKLLELVQLISAIFIVDEFITHSFSLFDFQENTAKNAAKK